MKSFERNMQQRSKAATPPPRQSRVENHQRTYFCLLLIFYLNFGMSPGLCYFVTLLLLARWRGRSFAALLDTIQDFRIQCNGKVLILKSPWRPYSNIMTYFPNGCIHFLVLPSCSDAISPSSDRSAAPGRKASSISRSGTPSL